MAQHLPLTDSDWLASWRGDPATRPGHPSVRYEEGIGFDTDVPAEFRVGLSTGSGVRPNQNLNVFEKPYDQTMRERAHVGSAAWVDAPDHLRSFVEGTADDRGGEFGERTYAHAVRSGGHHARPAHAKVLD